MKYLIGKQLSIDNHFPWDIWFEGLSVYQKNKNNSHRFLAISQNISILLKKAIFFCFFFLLKQIKQFYGKLYKKQDCLKKVNLSTEIPSCIAERINPALIKLVLSQEDTLGKIVVLSMIYYILQKKMTFLVYSYLLILKKHLIRWHSLILESLW